MLVSAVITGIAGCAYNMSEQPRYNPEAPSDFFPDGSSARPAVPGTIPHQESPDQAFRTGKHGGLLLDAIPVPLTKALLERGQQRFDIYCSPCHGRTGDGAGMVVNRGFREPPSYHIQRLRDAPDGHFFDVITNGFGEMASYAERVTPADRWAITAYIRALQLSQGATIADVPPAQLRSMTGLVR